MEPLLQLQPMKSIARLEQHFAFVDIKSLLQYFIVLPDMPFSLSL